MSITVSFYSESAFKEFILPPERNADYSIILRENYFGFQDDIKIKMEVISGEWSIKRTRQYTIVQEEYQRKSVILKDQAVITLYTIYQDKIYMFIRYMEEILYAYKKYTLSGVNNICIGKNVENDICYDFRNMVSKEHAEIRKYEDGYIIKNHSQNGVYVNSVRIMDEKELDFGAYINILGLHIVYLGNVIAIDAGNIQVTINSNLLKPMIEQNETSTHLEKKKDNSIPGGITYHRAPRNYEKLDADTIEIEAPPQLDHEKKKSLMMSIGPSLSMSLPMLLGCLLMVYSNGKSDGTSSLYMYSGLVMSVSSAVTGVVWTLLNQKQEKKDFEIKKRHRYDVYSKYLEEKTSEIRTYYKDTTRRLQETYPDARVCLEYDENKGLLWNRNFTHDDFLAYRLGIGEKVFQYVIDIPKKKFTLYKDELSEKPQYIKEKYCKLIDVPIIIDFYEKRLIGIVGGNNKKNAIDVAKILVSQIASNNCYVDVKLAFIYDNESSDDNRQWDYVKWLPHVWSEDKRVRYVAAGKEDASEVFYELTKVFRRRDEHISNVDKKARVRPHYIVFISKANLLEGQCFAKYALEARVELGLTTVILTDRREYLPNECEFLIENSEEFKGFYNVYESKKHLQQITFDQIGYKSLNSFARHLSSLHVAEMNQGGEIPEAITFFEMYGIDHIRDYPVREMWAKSKTYENIKGMLGQRAGGAPCYLDVHEKYHGPHGLVAGTTGSGKSETLQTYILSLAINYSPDDVGFFIIDYKGGGMANLFDGLPHMIGSISNLSGNQVKRAMISIKSENRRRQRIFAEHGVNNINLYTKLYKSGEAVTLTPIPHLFIIIDEFAELKREEPEFMNELISVAQVGRSLGVHLILSTQKPSGTVDDNIWSNSKFRLCLRVQNQQDSKDMLHKPDAAYITQAGRGYLQVGNDEVYELFQSGFSGAVFNQDSLEVTREIAKLITTSGKVDMTGNSVRLSQKRHVGKIFSQSREKTQLDVTKEYLAEVAKKYGYDYKLLLWLPVLKEKIYLSEFDGFSNAYYKTGKWDHISSKWNLQIIIGQADDPENQCQMPVLFDFAEQGHVVIIGSVVSGKSTLMQTMAYSLINMFSPEYVNIYALDFSSHMLSAFETAPHVGGIMYESDEEKISKFFNMMDKIIQERKELFKGGNYRQYVQGNGIQLPAIVMFVDNYASFKEKTDELYEKQMIQLSKEGVSLGIYLVISGAGFGYSDITTRVGENLETAFCLALPEKHVYGEILHDMQIEVMPESGIKGRGLTYCGSRILEYQAALALEAENDYQRVEAIQVLCRKMKGNWKGKIARQIPEIPENPTWSSFIELADYKKQIASKDYLAVAYDEADAEVYSIPLKDIYCYLVTGASRTGKSNYMKVMLQAALDKKAHVAVLDGPKKDMRSFTKNNIICYFTEENEIFEYFRDQLTPVFQQRNRVKNSMLDNGKDELDVYGKMREEQPYFVFIPDFSWFINMIYKSEHSMAGFMETLIMKGRYHNIYFVAEISLNKFSEVRGYRTFEAFAEYRTGIHFGGRSNDNTIMPFEYMSFAAQAASDPEGVGRLPGTSTYKGTRKIVVPLAGK